MLTRKQLELLRFVHERLKESGVPPSFDEMKDALDLRSKSGIHRLITALEERGFIRRLPNRARAVEVVRLPDAVAHGVGGRSRGFTPNVIQGNLGRVRADSMDDAGILDGDIALIRRTEAADTGDIVVALIDEEEATLKRFRRRGASIALEPANSSHEVRILPPNRVKIQGKLVGLFRRY